MMHREASETPVYPTELDAAIRVTLSRLARIDYEYGERRAALARRSLSQGQRMRIRAELDARHRKHRGPLVLHLADLHYRLTRASICASLPRAVQASADLSGLG
jgi:hypothetical protein